MDILKRIENLTGNLVKVMTVKLVSAYCIVGKGGYVIVYNKCIKYSVIR